MILIVASCFDKSGNNVVGGLMSGVKKMLENSNVSYEIIRVPGANEIPVTVQHFLSKYPEKFSVAVTLGLIIKGDTDHYEMVRDSVTMGITNLSLQYNTPIVQGVLACHVASDAIKRKHLGQEFGKTAIEMIKIKSL